MGDINSSSSRFSVFIIPDQHYTRESIQCQCEEHIFSRWIFDDFTNHWDFTQDAALLLSKMEYPNAAKMVSLMDSSDAAYLLCFWRFEIYRNQMWGRSVVELLRYKFGVYVIYGVTTWLYSVYGYSTLFADDEYKYIFIYTYTLLVDESTISATLFGWRG